MKRDENTRNEDQRANKLVTTCYQILAIVFTIAYSLEILKGTYSAQHVIIDIVLIILPLIVGMILYRINRSNQYIKDVYAIGFSIFFLFVMLTENDPMHFAYIMPMLCMTTFYHKWKFTLRTALGVVIVIAIFGVKGLNTKEINTGDLEIIAAVLLLMSTFLMISSRFSESIYSERLDIIKKEQEKEKENVNKIQDVSRSILKK